MSSIRPLITITILVVVGVFLFTKINEGPAPIAPGTSDTFDSAPALSVPPLASTVPASAPTWGDETAANSEPASQRAGEGIPPATPSSNATVANAAPAEPTVPEVPELPPITPLAGASAATAPTPVAAPIELPANVPTARYPSEADTASTQPIAEPTPEPPAIASETNQIPPATESARSDAGRYDITPVETQSTPTVSSEPTFAKSWPTIQSALERQELVQAHEMLSQWYGNPNLSPTETEQVESLLNQLAGTVVYSTEHRLEPPYTVNPGDTLQTIAQQYQVPWQLLAKINGIPAADMVQPGQQLKVVHGPFSAVVEIEKGQMTLVLDGRYAGRFDVAVEQGTPLSEGQWVVEQKLVNPAPEATGVVSASYAAPTSVDRVLVLRSESSTAPGATISITGGPVSPAGPTAVAPAAIRLSPTDAEEVADILSVGSRVTIVR